MKNGSGGAQTVLITGGAGFIGTNLAQRFLAEPNIRVRIFDNLSRRGVEHNLSWLRSLRGAGNRLEIVQGDVRNANAVANATRDVSEIYHLAAQVAVTTSIDAPETDFEINAQGTLRILEAARRSSRKPFVLFTSTNKVYGSLEGVPVHAAATRYEANAPDFPGVNEHEPLDFHSPYGCSKGTADQYVRDYARIYNLPTVVFRMSCIAGPRQFGNEDQGWVAHFLYSALAGRPITVYGDGRQVRDILHVHDLVDAMFAAREHRRTSRGQIYNLGGGPSRTTSVLELLREIETRTGQPLNLQYKDVRPGDQPLYISDTAKIERDTGWRATRSLDQILADIRAFWTDHSDAIRTLQQPAAPALELVAEEVA
ncbi:MAG TPA: GDP-mannose 4,6-dehydratase [Acidobacteriaceae bacterium]|nr:GDP-mannose 4,6-dehydratase [Acidobacteriaceae bacterium]